MSYHRFDADILIVGAGVAGLTAAYILIKKDPSLNIIILEKEDRIGGRVSSIPLLIDNNTYQNFDLGGQWINSRQKYLLNLLSELDVPTEQETLEGKMIVTYKSRNYKITREKPLSFCNAAAKVELNNFLARVSGLTEKDTIDPQLTTMTMQEFIDNNLIHRVNKSIIRMLILLNCGLDPCDITVEFYIYFCISTHGLANLLFFHKRSKYWIKEGAQELCNRIVTMLQHDIILHQNTKVTGIKTRKYDVEVTTSSNQKLYTRNIIITVPPPNILEMKLMPELPSPKLSSLHNSLNSKMSKFVATFKEAFWKKNGLSGEIYILDNHSKDSPLIYCFDVSVNYSNALSGYYFSEEKIEESVILNQLKSYFGIEVCEPLQFVAKTWNGGSPMYCYQRFEDVCQSAVTTHRIFWAGAETSLEWFGTMSGAVYSGYRAAIENLFDLRPSALTLDDLTIFSFKPSLKALQAIIRNQQQQTHFYKLSTLLLVTMLLILCRTLKIHTYFSNIFKKPYNLSNLLKQITNSQCLVCGNISTATAFTGTKGSLCKLLDGDLPRSMKFFKAAAGLQDTYTN